MRMESLQLGSERLRAAQMTTLNAAIIALCAALLTIAPARAAYPPPVVAPHAMVASAERDASKVGIAILKRGGNAVDAGVAVAFALAVVHPDAGNLAGGGFMMIHLASGKNVAVDFRETAPGRATRTMYQDAHGRIIPGASTIGYRAVAVPSTVAGLALAEKRFGHLSWQQVIEPARRLAAQGFRVSPAVADVLSDPGVQKQLSRFAESRRIFLPHGRPYRAGEWMKRPDLARTLQRLQQNGPAEFYRGRTARLIAADMRRHGGLITLRDLSGYHALFRAPVTGEYRGYQIVSMPLPSSGGITIISELNMLKHFRLSALGPLSAASMHDIIEAMRRAFADRARYLGDPAFTRIPVARLISQAYADQRVQSILPEKATPSSQIGPGLAMPAEHKETTHFDVVDAAGNAISCTYTLNGPFGSGATVPGTGIVLNNEMDDFASAPGVPNMFGLVQGEANAIAPGKRPLSSMTPTLVMKGKRLFLVTGSPGGPTIISTVLEILLNMIDYKMDVSAATAAPRFHHQWLPDRVRIEPVGFSPDTIRILKQWGYVFGAPSYMGDAQTIEIDPKTGARLGASDPRGSGVTLGY